MRSSVFFDFDFFLLASLMIMSCSNGSSKIISTVDYSCANSAKLTVSYYKDSAVVKGLVNGTEVNWSLRQVEAASGIRYSDGKHQLWSKGKSAQIDPGNGQSFECSE